LGTDKERHSFGTSAGRNALALGAAHAEADIVDLTEFST
jgi:hypothetical protein